MQLKTPEKELDPESRLQYAVNYDSKGQEWTVRLIYLNILQKISTYSCHPELTS